MKRFCFLIISLLLLTATPARPQDKVMQIYSGGEVAYEISTAQVDSITFRAEGIKATGYIVGYNQCGLTVENGVGHAVIYYFISEDLENTLTLQVHNFPQDVYTFPKEIFEMPDQCPRSRFFPEEFRYAFKVQLEYDIDFKLGSSCVIPAICAPGQIGGLHIPILVYSAKKIE